MALARHPLGTSAALRRFCALALREGFIPGNAHLTQVDPECADLHLPRATENRQPAIVVKNSSGFGGANVALVFRRVPA